MTPNNQVVQTIETLARERGRFSPQAYFFVLEALNFTLERLHAKGHKGHITGQQLLEGIRDFAQKNFGFLGRAVFESWGLTRSIDFGDIVFDLVSVQLLSKQETDTRDDFAGGFEFASAFEARYVYEE